ncbi:MAG: adenylate kinase [Elusimicrobiota bacterium]
MNIIFLGPPGSGKGTQAKKLSAEANLKHISTGDLLRAEVASASELGKKIKAKIEKGELVPDQMVDNLMEKNIKPVEGYILDGYPRTIAQAEFIEKHLKNIKAKMDFVVYFSLTEEEIVSRLCGRRKCGKCGKDTNVAGLTGSEANICKHCGKSLEKRSDDREDIIRNRIKVYKAQTEPLLQYYKQKGNLIEIDGSQSIDNTYKALLKAINFNK